MAGESKGAFSSLSNAGTSPLLGALNSFRNEENTTPSNKPKAYLNWILLDEQLQYVPAGSGADPIQDTGFIRPLTSGGPVNITKNGFLYIYVSNETQNRDVFFDNLSIQHITGPLTEETHYYPFGLTMAGISSKALKPGYVRNDKKYNGIEFEDDIDLNVYDAQLRELDPQMGRWWQIDPKIENMEMWSPYASNYDNPIRYSDPVGDEPQCCDLYGAFKKATILMAAAANAWSSNQIGGAGRKNVDDMTLTDEEKTYARAGQAIGDGASVATGLVEMGIAAGGELVSFGSATPIAIPLGIHGATSAAMGVSNLVKTSADAGSSNSSSSSSSSSQNTSSNKRADKLQPDQTAQGDHSTFKRDADGNIYQYVEWRSNPHNPSGFDQKKKFDGGKPNGAAGTPHTNKQTQEKVPTPHIQGKDIPGGVRPPASNELPNNRRYNPNHPNK